MRRTMPSGTSLFDQVKELKDRRSSGTVNFETKLSEADMQAMNLHFLGTNSDNRFLYCTALVNEEKTDDMQDAIDNALIESWVNMFDWDMLVLQFSKLGINTSGPDRAVVMHRALSYFHANRLRVSQSVPHEPQ